MKKLQTLTEPTSPSSTKAIQLTSIPSYCKSNTEIRRSSKKVSFVQEKIRIKHKAKTSVDTCFELPEFNVRTSFGSQKILESLTRTKSKKFLAPFLTSDENKVIKENVKEIVVEELKKVKSRVLKKVEGMNEIGVLSHTGNLVRGQSLYCVHKGYVEKRIPRLTRKAKSEKLMEKPEQLFPLHNEREKTLEKMKAVLLKDYNKTSKTQSIDFHSIIRDSLKGTESLRKSLEINLKSYQKVY